MFGRIKQLLGRSSSRPAPPESPRKDATRAQGNGNDKVLQGRVSKASAKDSSTKKPKKLSSAVAGAGLSGETEGLHRISTLSPHEAAAMENGNVLSIHAVEKSVNALEISGKERLTGESETDGISPPSTADVDLDLDLPNAKLSRQPPEGVSVERLPDTQDATGTSIHGSMEHQYSELHESIEDQIPEDSEDDGGSLLDYEGGEVDEERVVEYLRRQADGDARTKKAWRPEATALYEILDHRGEYPLMPSSWELCFRGIPIPPGLFCPPQSSSEDVTSSEAPSTTILCNRSSEEFRATRALRDLMALQRDVNSLRQARLGHKTGRMVRRGLMRYANWAARDGGYDNRKIIPNFTVLLVKASSEEQAEGEIESHFGELARRHREFLFDHYDEETGTTVYRREPPLIFGFAIIGHIAILITLDAADVTATTMALAELNLAEPNQGIWNGLTIAIVICQARDQMMKMMGDFPEKSREPESDVDA